MSPMFGLSKRFIFSFLGAVLITFAVLYGVHKATGPEETETSEEGDIRSARRNVERSSSSGSRGSLPSNRDHTAVVAKSKDEQIIMDVVASARLEVAEQQKAQREKMAPLMEKRREFFASLQEMDEQERNRLRAEWMETQRAEMMELRQTQDTESARASQRLASLGMKLQRLRRYDLVPELKPQANEIRTLMAKYAREHENSDLSSNQTLWTHIGRGIQELRMQHQKLMHPERFR